jgi:hypothetical protein
MGTSIRFRQRNHEWRDEVVEKERAVCIGERRLRMDFVDAGAEIERDSRLITVRSSPFLKALTNSPSRDLCSVLDTSIISSIDLGRLFLHLQFFREKDMFPTSQLIIRRP